MRFILLMIDGTCNEVHSDSKQDAISKCMKELDYEDYEDFIDDLNIIEWADNVGHYFLNYITNEFLKVPEKSFRLEAYTTITQIELKEEL